MIVLLLLACGPDFLPSLLLDREQTLSHLQEPRFVDFAAQVAEPLKDASVQDLGERAAEAWGRGDYPMSVRLYAQQARIEDGGRISLLIIARRLVTHPERFTDASVRRLVALFAYTRGGYGTMDAAIKQAVTLLASRPPPYDAADALAGALYRYGEMAAAKRVLDKRKDTLIPGLADWVEAKLALYDAKPEVAQAALTRAANALPTQEMRARANAELAILLLEKGDHVAALAALLARKERYEHVTYWEDAAYVAERVLTLPELETFVGANTDEYCTYIWDTERRCLADVLARRQAREGHPSGMLRLLSEQLERLHAPIARAEVMYAHASRVRRRGLEELGTEWAPDWAIYKGLYDPERVQLQKHVTAKEQALSRANAPQPNVRYHYRQVAAAEAEHAADLVPPRSQAYASLMCHAMLFGGDKRTIYAKYVKHGAAVPWAVDGERCPTPEFSRAQAMADAQALRQVKRYERWAQRVAVATVAALLGCAFTAAVLLRRRQTP